MLRYLCELVSLRHEVQELAFQKYGNNSGELNFAMKDQNDFNRPCPYKYCFRMLNIIELATYELLFCILNLLIFNIVLSKFPFCICLTNIPFSLWFQFS